MDKSLVVFDFDHTILNDNADTSVFNLISNKDMARKLWDQYEEGKWTEFMNKVMTFLFESQISYDEIKNELISLPLVPGMTDVLEYLGKNPAYDCIILSDANSLFIKTILEAKGLMWTVNEVITNPAEVESSGKVVIQPCHVHSHSTCPSNMCKGTLLSQLKQKKGDNYYKKVCYVGDGSNDLCPCLQLSSNDFAFPRIGYKLEKRLQCIMSSEKGKIHAQIVKWESGSDILNVIRTL
uniref:Probable phospholipid-transporting ATPase IIA n=1 Tax=Phallusia mammillata TaxID=59560 RepID=A0A6F9D7S4_9ASCI|nr:probable phospholipid-transporting ATPase IIA [Phallusia mammillata]